MQEVEFRIISEFLIDHIPLVLDLNGKDLKYDTKNMYYRIYRYILSLRGDK